MITCEEEWVYQAPEQRAFLFASAKVQLRWHSAGSVNLAVRFSPSAVKTAPRVRVTGVVIES